MRVLGVPGSLRGGSTNHALLAAIPSVDPDLTLELEAGVGDLPHFSPDLDQPGMPLPPAVDAWRARVAAADVVIVSSPEYVHGIPGALKNALDWLVSGDEIAAKPVALWSASPSGAPHAHAQLMEVLGVMTARLDREASMALILPRAAFDPTGVLIDATIRARLATSLAHLARALPSPA